MTEWLMTLHIQISIAVVAILFLRLAMKKMPKVYSYLLWLLVFARLLVPVSVESRFSFMPSEQEREVFAEQLLGNFGVVSFASDLFLGSSQVGTPSENGPANSHMAGNPGDGSAMNHDIFNENISSDQVDGGVAGDSTLSDSIVNGDAGSDSAINGNIVHDSAISGENQDWNNSVTSDYLTNGKGFLSGNESAASNLPDVILIVLWIVGAVAVLGYNGTALYRMRRLLGKNQSSQVVTIVNPFTGKEKSIPIYRCKNINTPFTLGLLKPAIYLPARLTAEEQEYILCHERVHISRKDNLVKHVAFLLTAIYWFNPFVWAAFFLMERDMEMSCDEKVLKIMGKDIKRNYSQSLLNFAEGRGKMPATHLTFGENSVKQRVKNVLSYKNAKRWSIAIGAVVLVVVVVALFTTGRDESTQVDGQGDQVQTDGQGNLAQGSDQNDVSGENNSGNEQSQSEDSQGDDRTEASGQGTTDNNSQAQGGKSQSSDEFILTKERFENNYGQAGNYDFSVLGYGDGFYRSIMQQLFYGTDAATKEYCEKFTDPVTAAVELLHLGEGTGSIVGDLSVSSSIAGGVADMINVPESYYHYDTVAEGTQVTVAYTFAQDNSVVEIPMVLIEGTFGIWAPEGTPVREVKQMEGIWSRRNEDGTVEGERWIEVTQYGIYRRSDSQLSCLYPCYVNPKNDFYVYENILLFVVDSDYEEGAAEYQEDAIAMLDLNTLRVDRDAIPLNINRTTAPIMQMYEYNGVLGFQCNNKYYHVPMVNTGDVKFDSMYTYNGKAVVDLTESEQDACGVAVREQLLQNPGLLLELSNRTMEETFALIDMDGDGRTERISLSPDPNATWQTYGSDLDNYVLKIGESMVTGNADYLYNQIFAFSMDGKEIVLALQEDGPSGDPQTYLFLYRNGEVKQAGSFDNYLTYATIENGSIYTSGGAYAIQTDGRRCQYVMSPEGELTLVEQDAYDLTALNDIKLLVELPIHSAPGSEDVTYMQPQTVRFTKIDKTFDWIYVEGEDGTGGWFLVGTFGWVNELKKDSREVFEGLSMAG